MADDIGVDKSFPLAKGFWLAWLPLLIYATGLLVISVAPAARPEPRVQLSDKAAHAAAYWLLSYTFLKALETIWGYGGRTAAAAASLAWSFGALMELWQYFLPYRAYEPLDLASNAAGAVAAQVVVLILRKVVFPAEGESRRAVIN